ncbi:Retrovirus-related Pol polyprotein from transposon TNT 1-94 [Sesamum angolense]|uniref:Retrovirus-related Pol polyprotein from transposon TNT 1-94 n=1 Tax=Sesamum angolense TaxID=2727404 RepID=A0AAE1W0C6_9LAMI|nr:Retrovirus-related Pol polyprotein from transposon TNT 1-94 [Sesamum angolense]
MKTYFQSQKLWEIVEEGVTLPEDSSTSSSAEKGKLENKKAKDSEALYYIQTSVEDHIFPRISVATLAKEAWSILQKEYQGSAKVRIIKLQTLKRDFENMKMKDSETIDEYYTKHMRKGEVGVKKILLKMLSSLTCRICKRTNHLEKDCYFRGKLQCRNCKRFGHVEKDCRLKGNHQANCIEDNNSSDQLFYTCNSVAETGEATWYIDSAASNHMTYNKGAFQTLDESFKTNVKLGDNHIVKVEGKGSVAINTKKGTRIINDVMYIPNLRTNLFSVGQMMEKGYTLHFGGDSCTIYDNKDKTLKIAEVRMKEHRCFPIHLQYMGRTAMKAQEDQSWLWHRSLGHFNFQGLKILHQKKMMTDLPQIQAVEGASEACLQGKQHKKPFPSGTSWRAKAVLELIHTDVFKKFKNLVEKQSGRSIKVLRSDRGKEYNNLEFDKFCEEEGIEHQTTVSYNPQQNGVSERKNRTVMEMARSMLEEKHLLKAFWAEAVHCSLSTQQVSHQGGSKHDSNRSVERQETFS